MDKETKERLKIQDEKEKEIAIILNYIIESNHYPSICDNRPDVDYVQLLSDLVILKDYLNREPIWK